MKYNKILLTAIVVAISGMTAILLKTLKCDDNRISCIEETSTTVSEYLSTETIHISVENPKTLEENDIPTMSQIYNKMLNSVDYFDYASGEFTTILDGVEKTVTFETDLNLAEGIEKQEDQMSVKTIEVKDGKRYIDIDGEKTVDTYVMKREAGRLLEKAYLAIDENGVNNYVMRSDNTNMELARMILSPQEMTFSFLSDFAKWNIVGMESYLNRSCCIIEGKNDEYMSNKLGIVSFKMWIDMETGILLNYEGYATDGTVADYICVKEIQIR